MQLLFWLILSLIVAVWNLRRPTVVPATSLLLFIMVPSIAGGSLTGGVGHPSTVVILVGALVAIIGKFASLQGEIARRPGIYVTLACLLVYLGLLLALGREVSTSNLVLILNTVVAPIVLLLLVRSGASFPGMAITLRNVTLWAASIQVVIAILSWMNGGTFLYLQYYAKFYWFSTTYTRALGTTDHPLVLALFLAAAIPLVVTLRSIFLQVGLMALFMTGIFLTEGRVGLLLGSIGVLYVSFRKGMPILVRIGVVFFGAIAALLFLQSPIASGVLSRFQNDGGSTNARSLAISAFLERWQSSFFVGSGPGSSDRVAASSGLATSFESAALIYAIDFGVIFTLLYFLVAVMLVFTSPKSLGGAKWAAVSALIMVQGFSSLATPSASGMILWFLVALASIPGPGPALDTVEGPVRTTPKPLKLSVGPAPKADKYGRPLTALGRK